MLIEAQKLPRTKSTLYTVELRLWGYHQGALLSNAPLVKPHLPPQKKSTTNRRQLPHSGPVELGATWFHGTVNNPIYDLAIKKGIVRDAARAAQLGVTGPPGTSPGDAAAGDAGAAGGGPGEEGKVEGQRPRDQWGVELLRAGQVTPLSGAERAAALEAMGAYGDALEEFGEGEGEEGGAGEVKTFGDVLRVQFDKVSGRVGGWGCG